MRQVRIAIGILDPVEPFTNFPDKLTEGRGGLLVHDVDEQGAIVLQIPLELFAFFHIWQTAGHRSSFHPGR